MRIKVKVKPNSHENTIKETANGFFVIKVSVPPENGKANKRVIELVSEYFKVPKSKVEILSGEAYHEKVIDIQL